VCRREASEAPVENPNVLTLTDLDLPLQSAYRWERERADRIFLTQPLRGGVVRHWTWAEAMNEARRMAGWLGEQNWEPGSRIGILAKNCAWWVMADLAIWMAGHVPVPVYPSLNPRSVRYILEHCGARACFVGATDEKEAAIEGIPKGVTVVAFPTAPPGDFRHWAALVKDRRPLAGNPLRPAGELATIIYTSGTTGQPKGVMHHFLALSYFAKAAIGMLSLNENERSISYLPLAHIVERTGLEIVALLVGCRIFFVESIDTFVADLQRARPTLFLSVPRLLAKFQQSVFEHMPPAKLERLQRVPILGRLVGRAILRKLGLATVRFAACGAAPLPADLLLWYRRLGLELCEGYGMTEILITHLTRPRRVRPGSVGQPVEGVEARISQAGELLVKSPMNMLGYYNDPAAAASSYSADGFFHTGDLGVIDSDGYLRIVGRIKEQFKTSKGKYVAPAPIEGRLSVHPGVESCCLMGAGEPSPFAVAVLAPDARRRCAAPEARQELESSLAALLLQTNAQLDPHERVAFIAIVDGPWTIAGGHLTPTLKLRRAALESCYHPFIETWKNLGRPVVWETEP